MYIFSDHQRIFLFNEETEICTMITVSYCFPLSHLENILGNTALVEYESFAYISRIIGSTNAIYSFIIIFHESCIKEENITAFDITSVFKFSFIAQLIHRLVILLSR